MSQKKVRASEEVLRYAVALKEHQAREGKATTLEVTLAWLELSARMLYDKERRGEDLTLEESELLCELCAELERKAREVGIDLDDT